MHQPLFCDLVINQLFAQAVRAEALRVALLNDLRDDTPFPVAKSAEVEVPF